jgi:hypothetical protein
MNAMITNNTTATTIPVIRSNIRTFRRLTIRIQDQHTFSWPHNFETSLAQFV